MKIFLLAGLILLAFAQTSINSYPGVTVAIDVEDTGCGICDVYLVYGDVNAATLFEPNDWVGVWCDMLPAEYDPNVDYQSMLVNDRAPGFMAVGQINSQTDPELQALDVSWMGVYSNDLIDRQNEIWNAIYRPIGIFDKDPEAYISANSIAF